MTVLQTQNEKSWKQFQLKFQLKFQLSMNLDLQNLDNLDKYPEF